jgi:hypothetical protein
MRGKAMKLPLNYRGFLLLIPSPLQVRAFLYPFSTARKIRKEGLW